MTCAPPLPSPHFIRYNTHSTRRNKKIKGNIRAKGTELVSSWQRETLPPSAPQHPQQHSHSSLLTWSGLYAQQLSLNHTFLGTMKKNCIHKNIIVLKLHFRPFSKYKWLAE